jgi:hypothetical protein
MPICRLCVTTTTPSLITASWIKRGKLLVKPKNYDLDVNNFADFLDEGKTVFAAPQTVAARSSSPNPGQLSALK